MMTTEGTRRAAKTEFTSTEVYAILCGVKTLAATSTVHAQCQLLTDAADLLTAYDKAYDGLMKHIDRYEDRCAELLHGLDRFRPDFKELTIDQVVAKLEEENRAYYRELEEEEDIDDED
jgi:hypothetical protein